MVIEWLEAGAKEIPLFEVNRFSADFSINYLRNHLGLTVIFVKNVISNLASLNGSTIGTLWKVIRNYLLMYLDIPLVRISGVE